MRPVRPSVLDGQRVTPRARPALIAVGEPALELPAPTDGTRRRWGWPVAVVLGVAALVLLARMKF